MLEVMYGWWKHKLGPQSYTEVLDKLNHSINYINTFLYKLKTDTHTHTHTHIYTFPATLLVFPTVKLLFCSCSSTFCLKSWCVQTNHPQNRKPLKYKQCWTKDYPRVLIHALKTMSCSHMHPYHCFPFRSHLNAFSIVGKH